MLLKPFSQLLLFAIVLSVSCNQFAEIEDAERANYQAEYAVPLVNTSFSMRTLLENFEENSVLTVLPNGLLRLQYSGDVLTENADDVFAAINETLSQAGIIPITTSRQALPFSGPDGLDIDRMELKQGSLSWLITNCHNKAITATLTFPTVVRNGVPLTVTRNLAAYSGTGDCPSLNNALSPINLDGYVITPENDSIYVNYSAIDSDGVAVDPSGNTFILIQNLAFSYAEGYLGQIQHSSGRDTIKIDFFDNWIRGDVFFEEPVITFNFQNSFGLPTRSVINVFNIVNVNGTILPLESEYITNGIDFPYPTLNEVGQVKSTNFVFNQSNSNIREVLGSGPIAIDYDVDAATNPAGNTNLRGFITDSSYYVVRVDVDLPLYGSAINFGVRDTFSLAFNSLDKVDYAEFKLVTENAMPIAIGVQGYFLDPNGTVLDSLFNTAQRIVSGAPVDAVGRPTGTTEVVTYSDFPEPRFKAIQQATQLELVATFFTTTEGQQSVQILDNQDVKIKLGAIFGVSGQ
ncbi:MAG: hypothetical protein DA408_15205 [Bacteroidetes bacterium]|nr:MAG: hypothetical protein C7N36_04615 [Bacteroidota bacterium]PTM10741.1 MAG: hypothetical protein DA408_15205 [Bacteroidota bacterium]